MKTTLQQISESEYKNLNCPVLFEDIGEYRVFGVISDGRNSYKLGWESEKIKPVIKWVDTLTCSIGADLEFIVIDFPSGRTLLRLFLDNWFCDTQLFDGFLYVITQLEIIKINTKDFSIITTYNLPDIYESMEPFGDGFWVKCMDNKVIKI